jgi:hypothetical protein
MHIRLKYEMPLIVEKNSLQVHRGKPCLDLGFPRWVGVSVAVGNHHQIHSLPDELQEWHVLQLLLSFSTAFFSCALASLCCSTILLGWSTTLSSQASCSVFSLSLNCSFVWSLNIHQACTMDTQRNHVQMAQYHFLTLVVMA